jgi:hypothetical protein
VRAFIALLISIFVLMFAADAGLSLVDELLHLALDRWVLGGFRLMISGATMFVGGLAWLALCLSPLVPRRFVVPPLVFLAWAAVGAMPMPVWLGFSGAGLGTSLVQAAIAVPLVVMLGREGGYLLPPSALRDGPAISARHVALLAALHLFLALPAFLLWTVASTGWAISTLTGGYAYFDTQGIVLHERVFVRGDDEVRLVGMVHLGESDRYNALFASFPKDSVLLAEGVSDSQGKFGPRRLSYSQRARKMGLVSQSDVPFHADKYEVRPADIDVSQFSEQTQALLNSAAALWAAETNEELMKAWLGAMDETNDPQIVEIAMDDVLHLRNRHLLGEIDKSLPEQRVLVVPWGALHLPEIEDGLRSRGFTLSTERDWRLLDYSALGRGAAEKLGDQLGSDSKASTGT